MTLNQWNYIKEVKTKYPRDGLRVRMEDKGARFIIEDAATENERIVENLCNPVQYSEADDNPIEGYITNIKNWAEDALEMGDITKSSINM